MYCSRTSRTQATSIWQSIQAENQAWWTTCKGLPRTMPEEVQTPILPRLSKQDRLQYVGSNKMQLTGQANLAMTVGRRSGKSQKRLVVFEEVTAWAMLRLGNNRHMNVPEQRDSPHSGTWRMSLAPRYVEADATMGQASSCQRRRCPTSY